jgi:hypothetical protein
MGRGEKLLNQTREKAHSQDRPPEASTPFSDVSVFFFSLWGRRAGNCKGCFVGQSQTEARTRRAGLRVPESGKIE